MNRTLGLALAAVFCTTVATVGFAEFYKATVSREGQNLYRVEYTPRDLYIKTRYCYVYCYYEEVLIDSDRMVLHFLDSNDECDIEKFLSE